MPCSSVIDHTYIMHLNYMRLASTNFSQTFSNYGQYHLSTLHVRVAVEELLQLRLAGFGLHPFLVHTALILPSGTRPWLHL